MDDEVCDSNVLLKKKAYLVLGITNRDTKSGASALQARLEYETNMRWDHFSEEALIFEFVEKNGLHPLCRNEWLKPIRNNIIVDLFEKLESVLTDEHSGGVILSGPFLVNQETRKDIQDILEEDGFEVEVIPISSSLMSILINGYQTGENTNDLFWLWKMFNEQFSRTYIPNLSLPKAVVIDSGFLKNNSLPGYDTVIKMVAGLQDECAIIVMDLDGDTPEVNEIKFAQVLIGKSKKDLFWSKLAYHFNVLMVLEGSANDVIYWHQINVPCISLVCQLALEKIV